MREGSRRTGEFQGSVLHNSWMIVTSTGWEDQNRVEGEDDGEFQSGLVEFKMPMGLPSGGV